MKARRHSVLYAESMGSLIGILCGLAVAGLLETALWLLLDRKNISWLGSFLDFNPLLLAAAGAILGMVVGERVYRHWGERKS